MALIQTPNFSCTEPNEQTSMTNFLSSLSQNEHFSPFDLSSATIKISV